MYLYDTSKQYKESFELEIIFSKPPRTCHFNSLPREFLDNRSMIYSEYVGHVMHTGRKRKHRNLNVKSE